MNRKQTSAVLGTLAALVLPLVAQAQSSVQEDFTKATTTNPWYFFNGACLTAGSSTGVEPSTMPGCTSIAASYYNKTANEVLTGGFNGTFPDPTGSGALRFTNGYPYGFNESGAIVSTTPFPTGQGVSITFKTVTYLGNSGGSSAGDGADGISFYLMDALKLNTAAITGKSLGDGNGIGSFGGSLGYSCSNNNSPYNGLNGGYLGLGIDEFGNFLNGTVNTLGEPGTTASGDNTNTGGGYKAPRIGLRGAGSISWSALNSAYGTDPGNTAAPYYPAALVTSCAINGGSYDSNTGGCMSCSSGNYNLTTGKCDTTTCSSGTYNASTGLCEACASGNTYDSVNNQCVTKSCSTGTYNSTTGLCETCPNGGTYSSSTNSCSTQTCSTGTYNSSANKCETCASGTYNLAANKCEICAVSGYTTYDPATVKCWNPTHTLSKTPTTGTPSATTPQTITATGGPTNRLNPTASNTQSPTPTNKKVDWYSAVQNTCKTGELWNYGTPSAPSDAGAASLTNAVNTAGILDYGALPGGYSVLPTGTQIAAEGATTRGAAVPIYYQLKVTQNGLLSLSYAVCPPAGCGAWQGVLTNQNITTANGPLPTNFLFGFAGSTGGSSNIHEILCFRADPATTAASSAGASEKQSAKLETGVQAYFAYYNPSSGYTGRVTASFLQFDGFGGITVAPIPNWDASCVLTGVLAGSSCSTTTVAGPTAAQPTNSIGTTPATPIVPNGRKILTWSGTSGIPFQYSSLTTTQQSAIDMGDASATADRVNFLRGDRTNEINSAGAGEFRRRTGVLGDIVDSSPTWVGAPGAPYTASWSDRLVTTATPSEDATTAQTYPAFASAQSNRTQVVYVGSNDGLLHGFRSGVYNSSSGSCATTPSSSCFTNNDGLELLAYMPGVFVSGANGDLIHPDTTNPANVAIDYANPQYGHQYYVDATPGSGDLFYGGQWHSWVVGGLGAGGAALYALDVTDPANFSEANAASLVMGEWNNGSINCVSPSNCGQNLGNTFGTPQIRRLHDGRWAVIFGNGLNSASGDAGIFVMTLDPTTGAQGALIYYLSTGVGSAASPNGISYTTPADLDGDHITDYVYAGDVKGNVWRFDLTSSNEASWKVTPGPLFSTGGLPITTQVVVASGAPSPGMLQQLMVLFGTGQKVGFNNAGGSSYASGTQNLYGVWDWNVSAADGGSNGVGSTGWDGVSTAQYAGLTRANAGVTTLTSANLQAQTVTIGVASNRDIMNNASICWTGGCPSQAARQFGWYMNLPGSGEQVVFSPELVGQALTVNSIIPANNSPISCANNSDTGFTYVVSAMTGGAFNTVFLPPSAAANPNINGSAAYADAHAIAIQTNATGSSFITSNSAGTQYLVYETNAVESGTGVGSNNLQGGTLGLNLPPNTTGHRLSWIELR